DKISDDVLLYNPRDSRITPEDKNGLLSIKEKTSEYKKDCCIAAWTVVASSTLYCCPHPERKTKENIKNHHSRCFMFTKNINTGICIIKKPNIATDRKYTKI